MFVYLCTSEYENGNELRCYVNVRLRHRQSLHGKRMNETTKRNPKEISGEARV